MLAQKLLSSGAGEEKLYVDDVFSAYTYTGNGSTLAIDNGINLAGKGGLVWQKNRGLSASHFLVDTARGVENGLSTNSTNGQNTYSGLLTSFASNGFNLGAYNNNSLQTYVSWTFRKAPKFFDVVTYTGNNGDFRSIPHSLGISPGLVIIKDYSFSDDWHVYHANAAGKLVLNTTAAQDASGRVGIKSVSSTSFTVSDSDAGQNRCNALGSNYVAYLFAHDTSTDGLIQCGSFTTNGSGNATVSLGWEPQYLLVKRPDSATSGSWFTLDTMRGWSLAVDGDNWLYANTPTAENGGGGGANYFDPTATGFKATSFGVSGTFIYMAIRRPNKPPKSGGQVFQPILNSGALTPHQVTSGIATDLMITKPRALYVSGAYPWFVDRLRGALALNSHNTDSEKTKVGLSFTNTGVVLPVEDGFSSSAPYGAPYITYHFKRAPGVFDSVCYTGTGVSHDEAHNLGVAPELIIVKSRDEAKNWIVWSAYCTTNYTLRFNLSDFQSNYIYQTLFGNDSVSVAPRASSFTIGSALDVNTSAKKHVAYLFATKAGISKVGSYTGNGSTQTINCGFTTGARFALIKRTDNTGDWFVWDTARGIVAGTDPHLSLNTNAAEVTSDDSIDPDTSGFIVNQVAATDINVTGASYIFLSFA